MANIALNGNVSASNTVAPFSASRAVDGIIEATHRWVGEVPCWFQLTLTGPKLINRWVVSNMTKVTGVPAPGWPSPNYNMAEYSLQGSNDNLHWNVLDTVSGNQVTTTDKTLVTPANYQFYRVSVSKGLNCNNKIASIMDFQLYEIPATSQYLSNLTISSGTLAPAFNKNTYSYTASVGFDTTSITVTPTAEVPVAYGQNAAIKVNGVSVASGAGTPVNLNLGVNTIYVDVTSAVGNVTQRYTLTVTRSDSNYLSNLVLMNGTTVIPLNTAFAPATASYTANVGFDVTSLTVTATKQSPNANITINGSPATSGQAYTVSNLAVGANTITVAVTTPGMAVQNYTVVVTRASNPYLSKLAIAGVMNLTPKFDTNTFNYTANIANSVTSVKVTPTAIDTSATVTVNGQTVNSGQQTPNPISIVVGPNTITACVNPTVGSDQKIYTVILTRLS